MLDDLERVTRLWKEGALSDSEFAEQKRRLLQANGPAPEAPEPAPEAGRRTGLIYAASAVLAVAIGSGSVYWMMIGHGGRAGAESAATSEASASPSSAGDAAGAPENPELAENAADQNAAAANAGKPLDLKLRLRCSVNGNPLNTFQCFYGSLEASSPTIGGSLKLTSGNRTVLFDYPMMVSQLRGTSSTFALTPDFRAEIQSNSDDAMKLDVEVMNGDQVVYSNQFNSGDGTILTRESLQI